MKSKEYYVLSVQRSNSAENDILIETEKDLTYEQPLSRQRAFAYVTKDKLKVVSNDTARIKVCKKSNDTFLYGFLSDKYTDFLGRKIPFMFGTNSKEADEVIVRFRKALAVINRQVNDEDIETAKKDMLISSIKKKKCLGQSSNNIAPHFCNNNTDNNIE